MVNPTVQFVDVQLDEIMFPSDEWLQMVQQKHEIEMMLFGERDSLETENQVEENLFEEQSEKIRE